MSIGQRIVELRNSQNISQFEIAKALDVSRQAVSKWENDKSSPDTINLIRLADLLNTDVQYLATGAHAAAATSPAVITVDRIIEKPVDRIIEVEKIVEVEKLVEVERVVEVDKIVEKVVHVPEIRRVIRNKRVRDPLEYGLVFIAGILIGVILTLIF